MNVRRAQRNTHGYGFGLVIRWPCLPGALRMHVQVLITFQPLSVMPLTIRHLLLSCSQARNATLFPPSGL